MPRGRATQATSNDAGRRSSALETHSFFCSRPFARLWLCADLAHPAFGPEGPWRARLAHAQTVAPVTLWLRPTPDTSARALLALARDARALLAPGSALLVGERVDVALAAEADGVHLPERALAVEDVRALCHRVGRPLCVSAAAHDRAGIARSRHADALVVAPFGAVPGKGPALGDDGLRALRAGAPGALLVALGGLLHPEDCARARAAGADAVALRRGWLDAPLRHAFGEVLRP